MRQKSVEDKLGQNLCRYCLTSLDEYLIFIFCRRTDEGLLKLHNGMLS